MQIFKTWKCYDGNNRKHIKMVEKVLTLIDKGAVVIEGSGHKEETIFHRLMKQHENETILKILLRLVTRNSMTFLSYCNETPLHVLMESSSPISDTLFQKFDEIGVNYDVRLPGGDTLLHLLMNCVYIKPHTVEIVKQLLSHNRLSANIPNDQGELPIHRICRRHMSNSVLDILKILVEVGQTDINHRSQCWRPTPLSVALYESEISSDSEKAVEFLIQQKTLKLDTDVHHLFRILPYFYYHPLDILEDLKLSADLMPLNRLSDINMQDKQGYTPLHCCIKSGMDHAYKNTTVAQLEYLISVGGNIHLPLHGVSPLRFLLGISGKYFNEHVPNLIKVLIKSGAVLQADPNFNQRSKSLKTLVNESSKYSDEIRSQLLATKPEIHTIQKNLKEIVETMARQLRNNMTLTPHKPFHDSVSKSMVNQLTADFHRKIDALSSTDLPTTSLLRNALGINNALALDNNGFFNTGEIPFPLTLKHYILKQYPEILRGKFVA